MTFTAARIALGFSALVFTAGTALSGDTATGGVQTTTCTATLVQASAYHVGTNARHANTIPVRYTAAHAMPPARFTAATSANCSGKVKKTTASLG